MERAVPPADHDSDREPLSGQVEKVVFHNPESGFAVLRVRLRGRGEPATVVGVTPSIAAGEHVQASGSWETTREHGTQFRALYLEVTPPIDGGRDRALSRLGPDQGHRPRLRQASGGRVRRRRVRRHRADAGRLREVEGIGPLRAERITAGWSDQKAIREIMVFLQSHGVSTARAVRIWKTYGPDAVPLVTANPYRLARDIRGIGFKIADQIAMKLGVSSTSPQRARAGLAWVLLEATNQGHCALPRERLLESADLAARDSAADVLEAALAAELEDRRPRARHHRRRALHLPALAVGGRALDRRAAADRLRSGEPPVGASADRRGEGGAVGGGATRRHAGGEPTPGARHPARQPRSRVLTGGPGVGKTTLVRAFLEIVRARGIDAGAGGAHRPRRQAAGREHRHRGEDHPPPARERPARLPPRRRPIRSSATWWSSTSARWSTCRCSTSCWPPCRQRAALLLVGDADQLPVGRARVRRSPTCWRRAPSLRRGWSRSSGRPRRARSSPTRTGSTRARCRSSHGDAASRGPAGLLLRRLARRRRRGGQAAAHGARPHPGALRPRPAPRRPGPLPDEPRPARRARAQPGAPGRAQSRTGARGRALRLELPRRRQGDADRERLRQGGLERRPRLRRGDRPRRAGDRRSRSTGAP